MDRRDVLFSSSPRMFSPTTVHLGSWTQEKTSMRSRKTPCQSLERQDGSFRSDISFSDKKKTLNNFPFGLAPVNVDRYKDTDSIRAFLDNK